METKVTKLSQMSNAIFFISVVYFLSFLWLEYHLHSIKKAFWLAIVATVTISTICFFIKRVFSSKHKSQSLAQKEKEFLKTQLIWGNEDTINAYLAELFDLDISTKTSPNSYGLADGGEVIFCFEPNGLDLSLLSKIIRGSNSSKITIFCIDHTPFLHPTNMEITFFTLDDIYTRQKSSSSKIPTNINIENKPKYSLKSVLCIALNKGRTKNYFWSSILLIFMSLFTPYNIYYLVVSTILLLLALYSRFNTRFNS